jgi:hypothetical protein
LETKKATFTSTPFNWGDEKELLLKEIDEKNFYQFIEKLQKFLEKIVNTLT